MTCGLVGIFRRFVLLQSEPESHRIEAMLFPWCCKPWTSEKVGHRIYGCDDYLYDYHSDCYYSHHYYSIDTITMMIIRLMTIGMFTTVIIDGFVYF